MNFEVTNSNYTATVVSLNTFVELAKCDNVKAAIIFGKQVIISKDTEIGTIGLFFPPECQISAEFLATNNLYRDNASNADPEKTGFFTPSGRVKTMQFRGHRSEGFFIPIQSIASLGFNPADFKVGDEFQKIDGINICQKYFIPIKESRTTGTRREKAAAIQTLRTNIVEGQLAFHYDTAHLDRNAHRIQPSDTIAISWKFHGTSAVFGRLLVNKPTPTEYQEQQIKKYTNKLLKLRKMENELNPDSWIDSIAKRWIMWRDRVNTGYLKAVHDKVQVVKEYAEVATSRTVVKSIDGAAKSSSGYYQTDVWTYVNDQVGKNIPDGFTVYGEIVGYEPGKSSMIQKGYDYGCAAGNNAFYVYRVTKTDEAGNVSELDWPSMKQFCIDHELTPVVETYYGLAEDFVIEHCTNITGDFEYDFVSTVKAMYLEKNCTFCKNKVPAEGVVVRKDHPEQSEAYKCKSFAFNLRESKALDNGEVDIESEESI